MILVDAVYICQSGGKNLLDLLIGQFENAGADEEFTILIDTRIREHYTGKTIRNIRFEFLDGREIARYRYYVRHKQEFHRVFCFANVPPPIRLKCTVSTYFHNVLLFDRDLQKYFPLKSRLLFALKGLVIKSRLNNTDNWIVQTRHVQELLVNHARIQTSRILLFPFFNEDDPGIITETDQKENAFFYPAIGASHKNHERLLAAWSDLFHKGTLVPDLHLTIGENEADSLYSKILALQKEGIPIINHGYLSKSEVNRLYAKCKFVIHPSLGESFGLVLIEALKNKCILLAPDLPYVKAIVQPHYQFDAGDVVSIGQAIIRASGNEKAASPAMYIKSEIKALVDHIVSD